MTNQQQHLIIGVLALQGAFSEHIHLIANINSINGIQIKTKEVRTTNDLVNSNLDGLILPGGESTAMALIVEREPGLLDALRSFIKAGDRPVWGTCAGMILLADQVTQTKQGGQTSLGALNVCVRRNAFGRQLDSFQDNLVIPVLQDNSDPNSTTTSTFPGVFIRAPVIEIIFDATHQERVEVLCRLTGESAQKRGDAIVAVKQGHIIATSFHPELTDDDRFHRYFLGLALEYKIKKN